MPIFIFGNIRFINPFISGIALISTVLFLALCVSAQCIQSQERFQNIPEAEEKFSIGIKLYQAQEYDSAYSTFYEIISKLPLNQRTTSSYLLSGKSLYNAKRFPESQKILETFLTKFPESFYFDDARFLLAKIFYYEHEYSNALDRFLSIIESKPSQITKSNQFLEIICKKKLSLSQLEQIVSNSHWKDSKPVLQYFLLERLASIGKTSEATLVLDSLKKNLHLDGGAKDIGVDENGRSVHTLHGNTDGVIDSPHSAGEIRSPMAIVVTI